MTDSPEVTEPSAIRTLATDHPLGALLPPHSHEEAQLVYARQGVMRVSVAAGLWVLPPLRALWIPPRTIHSIDCRTPVSLRTLYLGGARSGLLQGCKVIAVTDLLRAAVLRLVEGPCPEELRSLLEGVVVSELKAHDAEPLRLPQPADPRLGRIAAVWADRPGDGRRLIDWARELGMSERSLIRAVRRECGMTYRQWQRQSRLLVALEGLAGGRSVTTVALDCGYDSLSAFVQAFRQVFGVTPARYFQQEGNRLA